MPETPESGIHKPKLTTKVYEIAPTLVVKLTDSGRKNARYMTGDQVRRLAANVAEDGALTSVPLIYNPKRKPGDPEDLPRTDLIVVSGNHRVDAAVAGDLPLIWVMEVTSHLSDAEIVALQLSHNAITGQDDPNVLLEMYDVLDLDLKKYSSLTDADFKLPELDMTTLNLGQVQYQEVMLLFLPAEAEDFHRILAEIEKRSGKTERLLAKYSDFNTLFETICRAKQVMNVYNTAIAMRLLCDLATQHLDLLEQQQQEVQAKEN